MTTKWLTREQARQQLEPDHYAHLADNGSLTRRVRNACAGKFSVQLIQHEIIKAELLERQILKLADTTDVISRQVFLCCEQHRKIYAHTLIGLTESNRSLTGRIQALGVQSLGSLLFRDPLARKIRMHLALIPGTDVFFKDACLSKCQQGNAFWVRRNLYEYEGCELIVYEAYIDFLLRTASPGAVRC